MYEPSSESESSSEPVSSRAYGFVMGFGFVGAGAGVCVFGLGRGKGAAHSSGYQSILKPLYEVRDIMQVLAKSALWMELVET
jgi:hypothetical protein